MSNIICATIVDILKYIIDLPYFIYIWLTAGFCRIVNCFKCKRRKSLDNDVILITGAATGLGREVVLEFIRNSPNGTYVLWDINEDGLNETFQQCKSLGAQNVHIYKVDLSKHTEIAFTAEKVRLEVGNVTILFNNAGILQYNHFLDGSAELEEKTMQINLLSYMWTIREFLPGMIEVGKGQIVNTCSGNAFSRFRYLSVYIASKYGLRGFLECLKLEMRIHPNKPDIKFTTIYPGWMKTKMTGGITWTPRYKTCKATQNLDPDYVAKKMVDGILRESEEIMIPGSISSLKYFYGCIPFKVMDEVLDEHFMQNISIDMDFYSTAPKVGKISSVNLSEARDNCKDAKPIVIEMPLLDTKIV